MDLVLVRHARPERVENVDQAADPALTDIGHRQAEAMAQWLTGDGIDAVYVSPMIRARQTAQPLESALGLAATVVDGVKEYDATDSRYIPMEEVKADKAAWEAFLTNHQTIDWAPFRRIVADAIEDIITNHRGQTVAVVCHGGVVNAWAAEVLGLSETMFFAPDYTSISRFRAASSGERSIVSLNETAHLRADSLLIPL